MPPKELNMNLIFPKYKMAKSDWKKVGKIDSWKKSPHKKIYVFEMWTGEWGFKDDLGFTTPFKTKQQALAYAESYMRSH